MSNRHGRVQRRIAKRDADRRNTAKIPPAEWDKMSKEQKERVMREKGKKQ